MAKKSEHLGVESGKSSTRFFGGSGKAVKARDVRTPATGSDRPATGDGRTVNRQIIGKIAAIFKKP
jgi:hypothetical protein